MRFPTLLFIVTTACAGQAPAPTPPARRAPDANDFVRVRCATDGRDTITAWRGSIYAYVPGEAPRRLLGTVGMNVARCGREADGWYFSSRELMLYLDPVSGEVIHRWTNPWSGEVVPVVHVANDPVQGHINSAPPLEWRGDEATFSVEYTLSYPNPLSALPELAAPALYQAIELFELRAPAAEVLDVNRPTVSRMTFSWHRTGPWLPWMAQGDRAGHLVYSAHGKRVDGVDALPAELRTEIVQRLPSYAAAPRCLRDAANATSWRYFVQHVGAYQRGERFPVPEAAQPEQCVHGDGR